MMPGMIMLWSGPVVDIPEGWTLCDGTNDTPDLRNKFIIGAGSTYNPGDNGGALTHTHDYTTPNHSHIILAGTNIAAGSDFSQITSNTSWSDTTGSGSSLPPYFALCYIMKEP